MSDRNIVKAVLYARVSSDDTKTDGRNLQGQLDMGREYAQEKGYHVVAELAEDDRGASGASIDLPQLNKVRDMAQAGEFDVLVVREIDRLSRSLAKQLIIEEELSRVDIGIEYVLADYEDSPEGRLNKHIRATIGEYEREKIKERLVRGRKNKVKSGSIISTYKRSLYGYEVIKDGNNQMLKIRSDEGEIVRLIFSWFVIGEGDNGPMSMRAIVKRLTEMGIPTAADNGRSFTGKKRGKGEWCKSSVYRILKHKAYMGVWHYSSIPVDVPAIVEESIWQQAQKRLKENKENSKRNQKHNYLLARRLTCGCGAKMSANTRTAHGRRYQYYYCMALWGGYPHICRAPYFRADKVDTAVWEWLTDITSNPDRLKEKLYEYQVGQKEADKPLLERIGVIDQLIQEQESDLDSLLDSITMLKKSSAKRAKKRLQEDAERIEHTLDALEAEKDSLLERLSKDSLSQEQIDDILEFASVIRDELDHYPQDFDAKRELIELLDVQVRLVVEDDEKICYASAKLGRGRIEKRLSIASSSIYTREHNEQTFILTERLILA